MNKKIKTEIAIGIILIIAFIIGGSIWVNGRKAVAPIASNNSIQKSGISQDKQPLKILDVPGDWKQYKNDVLGIEFYYPEKWGEPRTEPVPHITSLAHVVDTFTGDNEYNNNIVISFSGDSSPWVRIFNERFAVSADEQAYNYYNGIAGNISDMKKSGNACDYKVDFSYLTGCNNGIKEMLTQNKEVFNFD